MKLPSDVGGGSRRIGITVVLRGGICVTTHNFQVIDMLLLANRSDDTSLGTFKVIVSLPILNIRFDGTLVVALSCLIIEVVVINIAALVSLVFSIREESNNE